MTANELAQLIEDAYPRGFVKDAANMLRQQAQEIEQLRNFISLDKNRAKEWFAYELNNEIKRFKESE